MMSLWSRWLVVLMVMVVGFLAVPEQVLGQTPKTTVDFARDVRPILANHCWACHGPDEMSRGAGLRLDRRDAALAVLDGGRHAIVPGKPDESAIVSRIEHEKPSRRMPPPEFKKPLLDAQRQILKTWIAEGAAYADHWAFVVPRRPALPDVGGSTWPLQPPDRFILERMRKAGLEPSPAADRETLIRRVSLDLTGLPPTPEEVKKYVDDRSPDAYEKAVDRLLDSPRYAEKMTLGWLDAARFADTNGYNNDEARAMWPWRDWVIAAFAKNMPYDRFLIEQIAGDLLPEATFEQKIATGFNRNHVITTEGGIIEEEYRVEYVADRVHTTATVFLGLSLQCARCHDHKYDPIAQKEYYQFFAFFNNVQDRPPSFSVRLNAVSEPKALYATPEIRSRLSEVTSKLADLDAKRSKYESAHKTDAAEWRERLTAEERTKLLIGLDKAKAAEQESRLRQHYFDTVDPESRPLALERSVLVREKGSLEKQTVPTMVMQEMATKRPTHILNRGQYDQRGDRVEPGVPAIFPPLPKAIAANRLALAKWLVEPNHPLTARVAVNRWWASYFGTGLVETLEDFGLQGELPSHPELLDWLATELIRTGWDVKAMQKVIVTSATYRQSSRITPEQLAKDPKNRLLSRSPRTRMPAEMIRDNALAISGLLVEKVGGPSVKPYQPPGLWEEVSVERRHKYIPDTDDGYYRRGMYTFWRRTCPPPGMTAFDAPDRETCVARRGRTNTPLQALVLLNDPTYVEAARALAERMMKAAPSSKDRVNAAFRLALCRDAGDEEVRVLTGLFTESLERFRKDPARAKKLLSIGPSPRDQNLNEAEWAAWTTVASTILNLDETISRP